MALVIDTNRSVKTNMIERRERNEDEMINSSSLSRIQFQIKSNTLNELMHKKRKESRCFFRRSIQMIEETIGCVVLLLN